jgi:hypothetical protein
MLGDFQVAMSEKSRVYISWAFIREMRVYVYVSAFLHQECLSVPRGRSHLDRGVVCTRKGIVPSLVFLSTKCSRMDGEILQTR